eukprot:GGOE01036320.1.p1 GENE.GGOE01036320.1~~GGOE01036320.1.p1  ORF type:complete len:131 (-),score=27.49 GGOE01036320.1:318-710(-)
MDLDWALDSRPIAAYSYLFIALQFAVAAWRFCVEVNYATGMLVSLFLFPVMTLYFEVLRMNKCQLLMTLFVMLEMGKRFDNSLMRMWWPYGSTTVAAMGMGVLHGARTLAATWELQRLRQQEEDELTKKM